MTNLEFLRYLKAHKDPRERTRAAILMVTHDGQFAFSSTHARLCRTPAHELRKVFTRLNRHQEILRDEKEGWWRIGPRFVSPEEGQQQVQVKPKRGWLPGTRKPSPKEEAWRAFRATMGNTEPPYVMLCLERDGRIWETDNKQHNTK